ncbi:MAG: hypothetical protein WD295_03975 [Bacteroidota bacterium]
MALRLAIGMLLACTGCNPFAPALDDVLDSEDSILGDQRTIDGIFQNLRYSYAFRDTAIYGELLESDFNFVFRDYDRGVDVTWGRDEEMRITYGLFQNVQRLDLVWNNIISESADSLNTRAVVNRNFNLTVTFNPADIVRIDGYVNMALVRGSASDPWRIARWRDESNF